MSRQYDYEGFPLPEGIQIVNKCHMMYYKFLLLLLSLIFRLNWIVYYQQKTCIEGYVYLSRIGNTSNCQSDNWVQIEIRRWKNACDNTLTVLILQY